LNVQLIILKQVAKLSNNYALIADEIGQGLYGELDYRHEAANAAEFALAHKHVPWLYVPKTLPHMTRRKVLVMEWLNGLMRMELFLAWKCSKKQDGDF
jgi:aarF domain-containing kinase